MSASNTDQEKSDALDHPLLGAPDDAPPPPPPTPLNSLLVTGVIAVSTLAVLAVIAFLYLARSMLIPVVLGLFFAYVLAPVAGYIQRWFRLPHGLAVLFVIVVTLAVVGLVGWIAVNQATTFVEQLPTYRDKLTALVEKAIAPLRQVEDLTGGITPAETPVKSPPGVPPLGTADDPIYSKTARDGSEVTPTLLGYVGGVVGLLEDVAIILFVGIFALTGWDMFREKLLTLAGRHRFDVALTILGGIHSGIQGYLWGMFLIAIIVAIGTTALLLAFSVPYAFLWGALSGILAFVPYVGAPLAIIPPLAVAYINGSSIGEVSLIAAIYLVFRTIEGQYITALLLGRHVDMNPLAVLISLIFWGWLWGPVGLVIGVPLTMVAIVVCDQLPGFAFVGELLGSEGHMRAATIITPGSAGSEPPPTPPLITTQTWLRESNMALMFTVVLAALTAPAQADTDRLVALVDAAIAVGKRNPPSLTEGSPAEVMHWIIAFDREAAIPDPAGGPPVNAVTHLCERMTWQAVPVFVPVEGGVGAHLNEGHPHQFLAKLGRAGVPLTQAIRIHDKTFTVGDLLGGAKQSATTAGEVSWTLLAMCVYLGPSASWKNGAGETMDIPKLLAAELRSDPAKAVCGGCHGLHALSFALQRARAGKIPITGVWREAQTRVDDYKRLARAAQNADGSFSENYWGPAVPPRDYRYLIYSTGHVLEWLMFELTDEEVRQPWVTRAAESLARCIVENEGRAAGKMSYYHAVHALSVVSATHNRPFLTDS